MAETLTGWLQQNIPWLSEEAIVFIISMIPILELRGGIIVAKLFGFSLLKALPLCIIGNIIPIPFILLFINKIFALLKKTKHIGKIIKRLEEKTLAKGDQVRKYEFWGLLIFVGIPLPGTGGWTGALLACLLEVDMKKAIPAIFFGLILASTIMSIVAYFLPGLFGF